MLPNERPVTYRRLLAFFIPWGAVPLLIASTHTLTDAALARLPAPELSLAVFAVVKSVTNAIKAPELMMLQVATAYVDDRATLRRVTGFGLGVTAVFTVALALLAFSPAGGWLLQRVIGLQEPASVALAYSALQIICLLPLVETPRNALQGLLLRSERSGMLAFGTLIRVLCIALFLLWMVRSHALSGMVTASVTWVGGIGLEALLLFGYLIFRFGSPGGIAAQLPPRPPAPPPTFLDIGRFFAPLALTSALTFWLQPIVQTGMARSVSPTESLAAYGVAWSLIFLLTGPVGSLHQCVLVFARSDDHAEWLTVQRFCLLTGAATSAILLLMALTPVGHWLVARAIGVPEPLVGLALATIAAFSPLPILRAWREAYWGLLLCRKTTGVIGTAKSANLLTVIVALLLLFGPLRAVQPLLPPVAGALAYVLGELVESLVIWHDATQGANRHRRPRPQPAES